MTVASGLIALLACGCEAFLGLDWSPADRTEDEPAGAGGGGGAPADDAGSGSLGTSSVDGGSSSTGPECAVASCPVPDSACQLAACVSLACAVVASAAGTPCAEDGGVVCDGAGACVECNFDAQCTGLGAACVGHVCESCSDALQNGLETDVDCGGGVCPKCDAGQSCIGNGDCKGKLKCNDGVCAEEG